ncbi:hypothetical protein ACFQ3R_11895 [Mesonia ostreae]|uniref:Outer membrane protein beta-barrel domain-containing protein n=1 Tax=Mesonia ostreae TaxID=861110 RepID=A0ABU2KIG4_9FLAO|nr:hypothetical protein [Mesonia ostreae]MDT0294469.1 hypothetical protein [Mesonia ostreae]
MNKITLILSLITGMLLGKRINAQTTTTGLTDLYTSHNKGKIFVNWGWNRGYFTKSDIHFTGSDYDFTIKNAKAHDKPKPITFRDYLQPDRVTIPQNNYRIGYFISDHYNISVGVDHMKYVMSNQIANVSGYINVSSPVGDTYNGEYNNAPTKIDDDFLHLEHTDGLNYASFEFSRYDDLGKLLGFEWNTDIFQINITEGVGVGAIVPKTNATILDRERYDQFHLAGFGLSLKQGINFTFFKHFFIQAEAKEGYINMPDIRTTQSKSDKASQDFFYFQPTVMFGGIFRL